MAVEVKQVVLEKMAIGRVSAQIYQDGEAAKCSPVLLYFHGGAFLRSGPVDCPLARCLASSGAIVVAPNYNAPLGGVFPHPLEVAFAVFCALAKKRAGFGDRKSLLIVAGDESGANIAAAVALKARDQFACELDGQVLASPLLDPFMGSASLRTADDVAMCRTWEAGWAHYLSGGICHPYAAPSTCSRLGGVAPALVMTSEDDPLRDESRGYARHLTDAGARVQLHTLPAATGWTSVYGGTVTDRPTWQEAVGRHFSSFIRDLGPP